MYVERNILYDDFFNLVVQNCGYNCKPQDLVMSYIPHFFHNEKVLPFRRTNQSSLLVYLGGAEKPPMLRVYVEENPIEENHNNVEECQQDMFNDEFHPADMNNHDDEIGIGKGEGEGEGQAEGPDCKFSPTPIIDNNNQRSTQASRVNNVRHDKI
ncbi:hypothetical protein EJD97_007678 [Solanum chilense]|uniref:Uncharacterized protein n=1 Tax=Solanum chilense TaxID=4083 RepID=A0A6N2AHR8_SOLCI|nr:hypothetical protein EJD97_007678 [Solanum chilense]